MFLFVFIDIPSFLEQLEIIFAQCGLNKILEKVGEEATESIIAAKDFASCDEKIDQAEFDTARHELIYEVADVWFHTLVGLAWFDIESDAVITELGRRFGLSGIDEKASRSS